MRIDGHVHWDPQAGYLERLVEEERRLGFDKVCLNGAVWEEWEEANAAVLKAAEKHADMIVPFAFFPLGEPALGGRAGADTVRALRQRGFRGLKFIRPPSRYDDQEFYPIYGAAEEAGLVCLFHTGIVARTPEDKRRDVNNERHRPIYLDTIARAFPNLKIVGAHLGNPWYEEAAMACRWNPNLYFDLSGSSLKAKPPEFFNQLLWWTETSQYRDPLGRHAWAKIIFGSDVAINLIEDVMNDFQRTMDALKLRPDLQQLVFGGTMAKLLGFER